MSLKQRVSDLASEKHMSIAELERTLNFANGSIGKWAKQSPSGERLQAVANYFGVSVDYLLGNTDEPVSNDSDNPKEVDLKKAMQDDDLLLAWDGRPIPDEEKEMIRRILDGGNK